MVSRVPEVVDRVDGKNKVSTHLISGLSCTLNGFQRVKLSPSRYRVESGGGP